jgi:undecaprenyl-diphosphatase
MAEQLRALAPDTPSVPEPPEAPARRRTAMRLDLLALAGFGTVFAAVKANRTTAFDLAVTLRIQGRKSRRLSALMKGISWPGFPPQSRIIPPGIVAFLWLRRHRLEAGLQAAAWGTAVLSTVVKQFTQRQRPLAPQVQVVVANLGGSSFPSGHVLTYVGVYGYAAHLASELIRPGWLRVLVVTPLVGLVALIGPSRIHQGHHWATDVLASYFLGLATVLGLTSLEARLKRPPTT